MEIVSGKGARLCSCRRQDEYAHLLSKARVPVRFLESDLSTFEILDPNTGMINEYAERARDKALKFLSDYPNVHKGLLFTGPVGVGKTHLAVSIVKGLIDRKVTNCLFYEFGWLLKVIQDSYNPTTQASEMQVLSRIIDVEVLVLDEIGASKPTDWVKDTLMNIINTRYNRQKITIFTTNYLDEEHSLNRIDRKYVEEAILRQEGTPNSIDSIKRRFRSYTLQDWEGLIDREKLKIRVSKETLQERIGLRLRSRMYEMCDEVFINGEDFRRKKRSGSRINSK